VNLVEGPITPEEISTAFLGSEDLTFDAMGRIVAKSGGDLIALEADGTESVVAMNVQQAYGIRHYEGSFYIALPNDGQLSVIDDLGNIMPVLLGLASPNGVFIQPDGTIWLTEFGGNRVLRRTPAGEVTEVVGPGEASVPNGVLFDEARGVLFWTHYQAGSVMRRTVDGMTLGTVEEVAKIDGAATDGLAMDACGNLYVVDQGNSELYRIRLDAQGAATQSPELLAAFPDNVANVVFGREASTGASFATRSLYAAGTPGTIYEVEIGVPGIEVP
jgi:sugar lactone lactonase YvrE